MSDIYTILDVEQGSEAWKQLRFKMATASQVPSLLGLSPYQTAPELLEEKITGKEADVSSYKQVLFQKGHDAELAAREWVEAHLGFKFYPSVLLSKKCPNLLASLDGFNREINLILEAKFMGAKALQDVKEGKIKDHHECQVQAQLLVSGADKCIYFATTTDGDSAIVEIKPSLEYAAKIERAVIEFMKVIEEYKQRMETVKEELKLRLSPRRSNKEVFPIRRR